MMQLDYFQYPYGSDNYGVLIHDPLTGETAAIDAGDADALLAALRKNNWTLSQLWITHHHGDHTAGLAQVQSATNCEVIGPVERGKAVAGIDRKMDDGAVFDFAGCAVQVIATPGHTLDMINFYIPNEGVVFTGDTLFVMGCGRLFEGTAEQMFVSLAKLAALPEQTIVYCSHEYTKANAAFALTVDPNNETLQLRIEAVKKLRMDGKPTVPSTIGEELATNPFLRAGSLGIREALNMVGQSDLEVFTELRRRKDRA